MRRRIDPLYLIAAGLLVLTVIVVVVTARGTSGSEDRTGSVYDDGPGGAAALRTYLSSLGAATTTLEGDAFTPADARVVILLGASELVTDADVAKIRDFVRTGGTVVVATELGLAERGLLGAYGISIAGVALPGPHDLANAAFADPPARTIVVDRGVVFAAGANADVLATDGRAPIIVSVREGSGVFIAVGSLWPFIAGGLADGDNARVVLALAKPALAAGALAFDEYHHGVHPSSDVTVLLERTWAGRALVFMTAVTLLYLILTGRRLGPPIPLTVRPARSSLEYVRGFAGLVRRSGRGEVARRRLRGDLRSGLARELGLDPATDFERVLGVLAARDRARAAEARAVDDALARPLREDQLLRTVRHIDQLLATS
ncbi:MAG TPA: DUF4350 domain-containing protein [Candidatus Limnocylindria bacterium]